MLLYSNRLRNAQNILVVKHSDAQHDICCNCKYADLNKPSQSSLKLMRRSEFWSHMPKTASSLRS